MASGRADEISSSGRSLNATVPFTIDRKRINLWHHRGDIRRVDNDPETGNPRFRVGQLLDRAARYRKRRAD